MATRRHPRAGTALAGAAVAAALLVASSCGTPDAPTRRTGPADTIDPGDPTSPPARQEAPSGSVGAREPSADDAPSESVATGEWRSLAQHALDRYDHALTELLLDPAAVSDGGSAALQGWNASVDPGSALSAEMLGSVRRHHADGTLIEPGPAGLSYVHHVVEVQSESDGSVSFSWCGYSPGVARDASSGAVTDDGVGHARGTGTVAPAGSSALLTSLDELDLEILPPGSPDPCTT